MSQTRDSIDIMSMKEGHSTEYFNPKSSADVSRIRKLIREKIKQGYYCFGAIKGKDGSFGDYVRITEKDIKNKEVERILLSKFLDKDTKKRMMSLPMKGG